MLELQEEYLADDLTWPRDAAERWTEEEAHAFFDSGGLRVPGGGGADQATGAAAASTSGASTEPGAYLAPVCYEVIHSHVNVRSMPSVGGDHLGMRRRGATVLASARQGAWIHLTDADDGWMMVDGLEVKMGQLMRVHAAPVPSEFASWQITRAGGCAAYADAGGGETAGWLEEGSTANAIAESGGWAQVAMPWAGGSEAWIELDACLAG